MKRIFFVSVLFLLFFCKTKKKNSVIIESSSKVEKELVTSNVNNLEKKESLAFSLGVVSINNSTNVKVSDWSLLNMDNSLYANFYPQGDSILLKGDKLVYTTFESDYTRDNKYDFSPKLFYPEIGGIVQFEYIKVAKDTFYVITNKRKQIIKKLTFKENTFIVDNWKDHLKKRALVGIDRKQNSMYSSINSKTPIYSTKDLSNVTFEVIKVVGDWIEVLCTDVCEPCQSEYKGWIRWRKDNKLLIDLYYTC